MKLSLGCIADDYTGASDLANTLTRQGLRTVQTIGVPPDDLALPEVDAVVVSLKSRSIEAGLAVTKSRAAEKWLRSRGADHVLFKICSTFDSTDAGNIGPVMDALRHDSGDAIVLVTPAFPETGRTVYMGNLFVGAVPLNESPLKDHPLNPMHDSNLVRVLARQSQTKVGLVNITLVLPFAAGSGTDTTTRIISKELGTALGVGTIIDNKAGANGSIAANYVARSAPDGYTLFVTTNTTHSANPYLLKTMSYDPIKDFTPIARTGDLPFMLVINPEIPANSVAELIALAKKEPGKYSYASGSSSAIVSGATFARLAGIDLLHVPYKSSPPALTDVIAGRVSMMFVDVLTGLPHVNGKALKALAVTTKQPSALLPQLPTMDSTVKGFDITSWQGYLGPANMPKDIVVKLNAEIRKVVERPDIKSQLAERGMEAFSGTPEEFDAFLKEQLVLWEKLIGDAGIEKQ